MAALADTVDVVTSSWPLLLRLSAGYVRFIHILIHLARLHIGKQIWLGVELVNRSFHRVH